MGISLQKSATFSQSKSKCIHTMLTNKLCCVVVVAFQLAPVLRYYQTLKYALKAYKCEKQGDRNTQRRYYLKMLKEDQDVALLRVFECFLEAAPQQILQLTILLKRYHTQVNFECIHIFLLYLVLISVNRVKVHTCICYSYSSSS